MDSLKQHVPALAALTRRTLVAAGLMEDPRLREIVGRFRRSVICAISIRRNSLDIPEGKAEYGLSGTINGVDSGMIVAPAAVALRVGRGGSARTYELSVRGGAGEGPRETLSLDGKPIPAPQLVIAEYDIMRFERDLHDAMATNAHVEVSACEEPAGERGKTSILMAFEGI